MALTPEQMEQLIQDQQTKIDKLQETIARLEQANEGNPDADTVEAIQTLREKLDTMNAKLEEMEASQNKGAATNGTVGKDEFNPDDPFGIL